jgi:hypothetical protein
VINLELPLARQAGGKWSKKNKISSHFLCIIYVLPIPPFLSVSPKPGPLSLSLKFQSAKGNNTKQETFFSLPQMEDGK